MNVFEQHFCTKKEPISHCISQAGLSWCWQNVRFLFFVSVDSNSSDWGVVELVFTVQNFLRVSARYPNRFVGLPCKRVSKFISDLHSEFHIFVLMVSSTTEIAQVFRSPNSSRASCLAFVYFLNTPVFACVTNQSVAHVITITRYFDFV